MGRFQPYERPHARRNKYRNAEAGPSTLIPASFPYVGYPTLQPSGGMISETTADAEQKQKTTEEDKAPVSYFYCSRIPRVVEWFFGVRRSPSELSALAAKDHPVATA